MSFFGKAYEFGRQVMRLNETTDKNSKEIQQLRIEVDDLTDAVKHLAYEMKLFQERERHEREKLTLQLENALLRMERRLPPERG